MEKLLIGNYVCCEDGKVKTNSYTIGIYDDKEDLFEIAQKDLEDYITDELCENFDLESEDEEEQQKIEIFKSNFNIKLYKDEEYVQVSNFMKPEVLGKLTRESDYFYEQIEVLSIPIENSFTNSFSFGIM